MSTATPTIKHTPEEAWLAGERVTIFFIDHEVLDDDGNVVYEDDPTDSADAARDEDREIRQVPKVERVEYTMPKKPNAGMALKYLKSTRTMGVEAAMGWLFELAIGGAAYEELSNETDFDIDDLATLMQTVVTRALGGLEPPK